MLDTNERLGELAAEALSEALTERLAELRLAADRADETWELWLAVPTFMRQASEPGTEAALAGYRSVARNAVAEFERNPFRWATVVLDPSLPSLVLEVAVG